MRKLLALLALSLSPCFATIARVQFKHVYPGAAASFTSAVTAANFIAVFATDDSSGNNPTVSDTLGNTFSTRITARTVSGPFCSQYFWYAFNVLGGSDTITVAGMSSDKGITIIEYSGVQSTSDPIDHSAVAGYPGGGAPPASVNILASFTDLVIAGYSNEARAATGVTGGFVFVQNEVGQADGQAEWQSAGALDAPPGTYAPVFTFAINGAWAVIGASFKSATQPISSVRRKVQVTDEWGPQRVLYQLSTVGATSGIGWLFPVGKYVYLSAHSMIAGGPGLLIYDFTNPAAPSLTGQLSTNDPEGIFVIGHYAYMVSIPADQFFVVDISNPASPVQVASLVDHTLLFEAEAVIATPSLPGVVFVCGSTYTVAIDVSNPLSPTIISSMVAVTRFPAISGTTLYEGHSNALVAYDVANPALMTQTGTVTITGCGGITNVVVGTTDYVTCSELHTIAVVNISNPAAMTLTGSFSTGTDFAPSLIASDGTYLYIDDDPSQLLSAWTAQGVNSVQVDRVSIAAPDDIKVYGRLLFTGGQALKIFQLW